MDMENCWVLKENSVKGTGKMTDKMGMEGIYGQMELIMKETGRTIKIMERGYTDGAKIYVIEMSMREIGEMI